MLALIVPLDAGGGGMPSHPIYMPPGVWPQPPSGGGGTPSHPIYSPPGVWPSPPVHVGGGPMPGQPPGIWGGGLPPHVGGGPMPGQPPGIWGGGMPPHVGGGPMPGQPPHVSTGPIVPAPGPGLPSQPIYVPPSIWPTPPPPPSQGDHILMWWPGVGWIWVPAPEGGASQLPVPPAQPKG
jgi:hypothetical protein